MRIGDYAAFADPKAAPESSVNERPQTLSSMADFFKWIKESHVVAPAHLAAAGVKGIEENLKGRGD